MSLSLAKALRLKPSSCIAFVGAGGKSTAIFQLARETSSAVIVTATTHLGTWQIPLADVHFIAEDSLPIERLEENLRGVILITGTIEGNRTAPIGNELLGDLNTFCRYYSIPLLIEADGSRQKNIKAWAKHEPPIPDIADHVVQVVGLSGLGQPLTNDTVHRAEIFSTLSRLNIGASITAEAVVRALTDEAGGLKNTPPSARKTIILNQADTPQAKSNARAMVKPLLTSYNSVLITSLKSKQVYAAHGQIAGIILAAGESSRFGRPKQLLNWKGKPFVRVIAEMALHAGLSPVIVVTGAHAELVEANIDNLPLKLAYNDNWVSGQGSSIGTGVRLLPNECEGAIFLLADQPQVSSSIIHALKERHAEGLYPIIAPIVIDRRANPVLFDRTTFPDLINIKGDTGGRAIFHNHRVEYLPWHDDALLLDVDTPEQYQRLIANEDL